MYKCRRLSTIDLNTIRVLGIIRNFILLVLEN